MQSQKAVDKKTNDNENITLKCTCQYTTMTNMGTSFNRVNKIHQFLLRIPPALKRRMRKYFNKFFIRSRSKVLSSLTTSNNGYRKMSNKKLQAGDLVRVLTLKEIKQTLNEKGYCKGLSFQDPMEKYCGKKYKVLKMPKYILDDGGKKINKSKGLVMLTSLTCDGVGTLLEEGCDRCCLHYWKTDWLEKID